MSKKHKAAAPSAAPKSKTKLAAAIELAAPPAPEAHAVAAPLSHTTQAHCVRADLAALRSRWEPAGGKGPSKSERAVAGALARLDEGWQALFRRRDEG